MDAEKEEASYIVTPNFLQQSTCDPIGNRLTSHRAPLITLNYDAANRLLKDDQFTYTYDLNGNLASKTDKLTHAVTTYTYDVENQLTRIDLPGGGLAQYRYDGLGRRIERSWARPWPSPSRKTPLHLKRFEDIIAS